MSDSMDNIYRMLFLLAVFAFLCFLDYKTNLKKRERHKQFLMPVFGLVFAVAAMVLLSRIYDAALRLVSRYPMIVYDVSQLLPENYRHLLDNALLRAFDFIEYENLGFWAFYVANVGILLAYVIYKRVVLTLLRLLFRVGGVFRDVAGLFYIDDEEGTWTLQSQFGQARSFLAVLYVTAVVMGLIGVVISGRLYLDQKLTSIFYPVFSIIILGELFFFLDGMTRRELLALQGRQEAREEPEADYAAMCPVLRDLFGDKLNAEDTAVSLADHKAAGNDRLLTELEHSDRVAEEGYGRFMRRKQAQGLELDYNYLLSGKQLLNGQSVLFNDPFYYDLVPYIFYPLNRTLLRHRKVLVVVGRHGAEESVEKWCTEGLASVTNLPSMWQVGVLTEEKQELDVGIVTRSSVHDLQMHEANREFFCQVGFVVLLEPSRLVTTAQVGLNSLIRHCRKGKKKLVFCSADKNCDGLLDALSHILMTSIREVSATNHHEGTSSYMVWQSDAEHLQHRMMPNLSRYLGIGTELSFAALKNRIPETYWCGGDAFPVVDIHWIARQYYYDLLRYAGLPTTQENIDRVFRVCPDMWSLPAGKNRYITVEDESFNMFEVKRAFSTRATNQGFVNVICSEYLLKDYMADNDSIFNADPKAIPYITADYARTARNMVLRLLLRLSTGMVSEKELCRELQLMDCPTEHPAQSLWAAVCAACGYVGSTAQDSDGRLILNTAREKVGFTCDVLQVKRRFNMESGQMEAMYFITDQRFVKLVLGALQPAEYIAEDENGERQYLGTELQGQIFQKYLPGQRFTFGGKYYEMLRVTSGGQVLVRRASDHIEGRPTYRQVRNYTLSGAVDSSIMGECRDMGAIRFIRQAADIRVETPAYWDMKRYNDFSTATKVAINGIPARLYNNKSLLRIDIAPGETLPEGTVRTLAVLINEVLRSLLAENQDYLVAVTAGDAWLPGTYSLYGESLEENSIYLIEDSQMDIGLLDAVERNMGRIFAIICDYLQWHEQALMEKPKIRVIPGPPPSDEIPPEYQKPEGSAISRFFKRIGAALAAFVKKLKAFFAKLFAKKGTEEQPEPEAEPIADTQPVEGTDTEPDELTPTLAPDAPAEEVPAEEATSSESKLLFSLNAEEEPVMDTAPGADQDTLDYEPEQVLQPAPSRGERPAYKDRCYLRYGDGEVAKNLQLAGVKDLLLDLGYGNNALTQARLGKNVGEMIERTFDPSKMGQEQCDFCFKELTGLDYVVLGDGRTRCADCGRTAVKSLDEFVALHDAVLRNMKLFFGIKINAPVRVQMVNSKKLHRKLGKSFIPTPKADGRVLGVAIKDRRGYTILVENGAPRLQSTMTMVHEMTHIWQYLNWDSKAILATYGQEELEVYEGMAKWVEIQYTYLLGETAEAKRAELRTLFSGYPYGTGFRKYLEKYPMSMHTGQRVATPFEDTQNPLPKD